MQQREYSDEEIIQRIRAGDESVLAYLYRENRKSIEHHVVSNNGTTDDAADILQDAVIVFWQKVTSGEFTLEAKINTFIYSICKNLWLKALRKNRRMMNTDFQNDGQNVQAEETGEEIISSMDYKKIEECLDKIGKTCKKILMLYYYDKRPMEEIAKIMGLANDKVAKAKKYQCKKALEEIVKRQYQKSDFIN